VLFFVLVYFCGVLLCVFTLLVPCCYVRYKFRITTIFGSFLPPDACKEARVLFTLFVFAYVYCFCFFVFVLCLVYPTFPVSLDCPFVDYPFGISLTCIQTVFEWYFFY